jgi:AcrR family transcriptional regulator
MTTRETAKRGRGRPRREGADGEILAAALAMLREKGYHDLTVDAVAEAVGVAKTTVYRRWPSKAALIAAALAPREVAAAPDCGSLEDDLIVVLGDVAAFLELVGEGRNDPEMAEAIRAAIAPDRTRLAEVLGRAALRVEHDLAADLLLAPLLVGRVEVREIVAGVLRGLL